MKKNFIVLDKVTKINQVASRNGLDRFSLNQKGLLGTTTCMLYLDEGSSDVDTDGNGVITAVRGVRNGQSIEFKLGSPAVGVPMDAGGYRFVTSDLVAAVNELNSLSLEARAQVSLKLKLAALSLEDLGV